MAGDPLNGLTDAELKVLAMLAEGQSNKAIAFNLQISPRTVEAHVNSIYRKLGLEADELRHRRVAAARIYLFESGRVSLVTQAPVGPASHSAWER